jgi:ATP-dependent Lhr-like helicase
MLLKPPHILITTPESLAILLVAPKFKEHLRNVEWVVLDEIHELCSSKRGVHLSLTMERLQANCEEPFSRVGLSATIHPLGEVAKFLVGYASPGRERECVICDTRFIRPMQIDVTVPAADLVHTDQESISQNMYGLLRRSIDKNDTTLVFTNTRAATERVVFKLSQENTSSENLIAAHHGSLSKETRLSVEDDLKRGKMRAVVTSSSLELGLDIGSIDLVVQLGTPKSITRFLQRVGRSGHSIEKTSKGLVIAMDRDDLVEVAAMTAEIARGNLDELYIPRGALDVLAQHLVGMSIERRWSVAEALDVVRRSYCYNMLDEESFRRVIRYLAGRYETADSHRIYGKIWYDENSDGFSSRGRMIRAIYCTNVGTIPDEVSIVVVERKTNRWLGQIQEEFLERMSPGDIFVLGGKMLKFCYSRGMKAFVEPAPSARSPTIPNWTSESLPLSFDLGEAISRFRSELLAMMQADKTDAEISTFVRDETRCDQVAVDAILAYMRAQYAFLRYAGLEKMPSHKCIAVENYFDTEYRQNLIFECVFGRRVNEALARALGNSISERRHGVMQVTSCDTGFMLTLPAGVYIGPDQALELFPGREAVRPNLLKSIRRSEIVRRRFRHCARRALMILRTYMGRENPVGRQQVSSQILLSMCEKLERFPILEEAYREVVEDYMDVRGAERVADEIESGARSFATCRRTVIPSPFSHNLVLRGSTDIVSLSERREVLRNLYDEAMRKVYSGGVESVRSKSSLQVSSSSPLPEVGPLR